MPLRPFPFPISIGTDIASIHRVQKIIEQGHNNFRRYIRRFLTEGEQRLILRQHGDADLSDPSSVRRISQHLAGRWAAKEATVKAVTWRKLRFHDIIIRHPPYSTTGYVHAVILDSSATTKGYVVSAPPSSTIIRERTEAGHHDRSNGPQSNTEASSGDVRTPRWLRDKMSEPVPPQLDVTTLPTGPHQKDTAECNPSSNEIDTEELSGQIAQISISHDGAYATAVCLAAQEPIAGDVGGELAARNL